MKFSENIILIDFAEIENWKFINGLSLATSVEWKTVSVISNGLHTKIYNIKRYFKYFFFPLQLFCNRKKVKNIVAWQQFYGLIYAFYSKLFKVKKQNNVIIMTFIYKKKKGMMGWLFYRFIRYIVNSNYVDAFICFSENECEYYSKLFNVSKSKFKHCALGIEDISKKIITEQFDFKKEKFILSVGRSNRDYNFLINSLREESYNVKILCDGLKKKKINRIQIFENISGVDYFKLLSKCFCVVIPLNDENISSGQLVALQAMQFGKPVIVTKSKSISEYVKNGETGFIINKNKNELLHALMLLSEYSLYQKMSDSSLRRFEHCYSLNYLGKEVGNILNKYISGTIDI